MLQTLISLSPLLGYLDPGTGSAIFQAVIGALLGAALVIKLYWHKLVAKIKGEKPSADDDSADNQDAEKK